MAKKIRFSRFFAFLLFFGLIFSCWPTGISNSRASKSTKSAAKNYVESEAVAEIRPDADINRIIEGKKLSENLEKLNWKIICKQIGISIAKLHDNNIIHGDLTTSNMILADKRDIVSVEINDSEIDITETKECICKANHFHNLDFGPKNGSDYPSSYEREKQINGLVGMVNTIEKLKEILATHSNINSDYNICRHGISSTISSFIIDVTGLVWYCNSSPCKGKFRKYVLS